MFLTPIIIAAGYVGILGAVFMETGFFLGFFLPGDSLLFTAGILAAGGYFNIVWLIVGAAVAAIAGDSLNYATGRWFGQKFLTKERRFIKKEYIEKTNDYYAKYGKKTIVISRFIPIVRTFAPLLAGVSKMDYPSFITYNVLGGTVWAVGFLSVAYYLGNTFKGIQNYLTVIVILIVIVSILPVLVDYFSKRKEK
jgi:membrane-associated protein